MQSAFVPALTALVLFGLLGVEQGGVGAGRCRAALGWLFYTYSGAQPLVLAWGACLLLHLPARAAARRPALPSARRCSAAGRADVIVTLRPGGAMRWTSLSIADQTARPRFPSRRLHQELCSHLNPVFLFWSGDINPRHGSPGPANWRPSTWCCCRWA